MNLNDAGIVLIKKWETLRLTAYKDIAGFWTIGWGHRLDVVEGQVITHEQADALFKNDCDLVCHQVAGLVGRKLTDNQFSALVSFTFNLGVHRLATSKLLVGIRQGDLAGAAAEFPRWCHSGGIPIKGLESRRTEEQELFLTV